MTPEPLMILTWNLGQWLKLTREKNKKKQKKIEGDVMSENCDVFTVFLIYGQFGSIWKPGSWLGVCKTYIFINSNLLPYKNWKQN